MPHADARESFFGRTVPGLLLDQAKREPDGLAYRVKHLGIYRERTWREYAVRVGQIAIALRGAGLAPGDRVAMMGDCCETMVLSDLAVQAAGAIPYGIYPTATPSDFEYLMGDGGASVFVCENQRYVDLILQIADRLPALRIIVVVDPSGMYAYRHRKLHILDDLVRSSQPCDGLDALVALAANLSPAETAFIAYTSGTTGRPKGVLVSHQAHLAATFTLIDHYPLLRAPQRTVAHLPLCHPLGRNLAITLPLMSHTVPHFGERDESFQAILLDVRPTVLITVPQYLRKFVARVSIGIANSTPLKRAIYNAAFKHGRLFAERRWRGTNNLGNRLFYRLLQAITFQPILMKLGLDKLKVVICGGAPLPADTTGVWHAYGVNVVEMYTQTEAAGGVLAGQRGPYPSPGHVGTSPSGWAIEVDSGGEIIVANGHMFSGYWNRPDLTPAVLDESGRLHTGDIGEWVDDTLRVVDRVSDFISTSDGCSISPLAIENMLRSSPFVAEAIVLKARDADLVALIELDFEATTQWATQKGIDFRSLSAIVSHEEVVQLIATVIQQFNERSTCAEQIKDFRILPNPLDPEIDGEPITPTRKVKRGEVAIRFNALIESMKSQNRDKSGRNTCRESAQHTP